MIVLISIKDGNRTIDIEPGSYGINYIELGGAREGPDWYVSLFNIKLESKTLQLTFRYTVTQATPAEYITLNRGTKQFTVNIS